MLYNSPDTYTPSAKASQQQRPLKRLASAASPGLHRRQQPPSPVQPPALLPSELYGALLHYHLHHQHMLTNQELFMHNHHHNSAANPSMASLQLMQRQMAFAAQQLIAGNESSSPPQSKCGLNSPALSTGSSHSASTDSTSSLSQRNPGHSIEGLLSLGGGHKRPYLKFSMDSILGTADDASSHASHKKLRTTHPDAALSSPKEQPAKDAERIQLNYSFLNQVVAGQRANTASSGYQGGEAVSQQQQLAAASAVSGSKNNQQQAQFPAGMGKSRFLLLVCLHHPYVAMFAEGQLAD